MRLNVKLHLVIDLTYRLNYIVITLIFLSV